MVVKFNDKTENKYLEVEKHNDSVSFFIAEFGEEQVGQFIEIPMAEIQNLIRHLQSIQLYQ